MFIASFLQCLAEVLSFVISSILHDLTAKQLVDVDVGKDLHQIGKGSGPIKLKFGHKLPVRSECPRINECLENVVKQRDSSRAIGFSQECFRAPG